MRMLKKIVSYVKHLYQNEQGVSLIEVIIIVLITAIAAIPLTRLSVANQQSGGRYGMSTRAVFYAEEVMEQVVSDYAAKDDGRGYDWIRSNWAGRTPSGPPDGLSGTVTVSSQDSLNGVAYVAVQVTVDGEGISPVTLETWFIEN